MQHIHTIPVKRDAGYMTLRGKCYTLPQGGMRERVFTSGGSVVQ